MDTLSETIRSQWSEMEKQKAAFLSYLESWDQSKRSFGPEGGWNALQIIEHLMTSESGTLQYILKKIQSGSQDLEVRSEREQSNGKKLVAALESSQRFKAPEMLQPPKGNPDFETLKNQWRVLRGQWQEVLSSISPEFQDRLVFRHPVVGMLDLEGTLTFLASHIVHHRHQLERIDRAYAMS